MTVCNVQGCENEAVAIVWVPTPDGGEIQQRVCEAHLMEMHTD